MDPLSPDLNIPFAIDFESASQSAFVNGRSPTIAQIMTGC